MAASGTPDAVVAEPEDVELAAVVGVVVVDEPAVVDVESTGGADVVVQADINAPSPSAIATPTAPNLRLTP